MTFGHITDHAARALQHLPPPLWGDTDIAAIVTVIAEEIQVLEDAIRLTMLMRIVDNAGTAQLHMLGRVVGEPNLGYPEATYRVLVKAKIRINLGHGSIDDFIAVGNVITGVTTTARDAFSVEPAFALVTIDEAGGIELGALEKMMRETRAAGVRVGLSINPGTTPGLRFGDASGALTPSPAVGSFGDASATVTEPVAGGPLWSVSSV